MTTAPASLDALLCGHSCFPADHSPAAPAFRAIQRHGLDDVPMLWLQRFMKPDMATTPTIAAICRSFLCQRPRAKTASVTASGCDAAGPRARVERTKSNDP
jgi:hypothetical protein